jgi:hypothetical protein
VTPRPATHLPKSMLIPNIRPDKTEYGPPKTPPRLRIFTRAAMSSTWPTTTTTTPTPTTQPPKTMSLRRIWPLKANAVPPKTSPTPELLLWWPRAPQLRRPLLISTCERHGADEQQTDEEIYILFKVSSLFSSHRACSLLTGTCSASLPVDNTSLQPSKSVVLTRKRRK